MKASREEQAGEASLESLGDFVTGAKKEEDLFQPPGGELVAVGPITLEQFEKRFAGGRPVEIPDCPESGSGEVRSTALARGIERL